MSGTIERLVSDKGFGFIATSDGTEYFFHQSGCTGVAFDELAKGSR
jgi:cold shock CspA family protein